MSHNDTWKVMVHFNERRANERMKSLQLHVTDMAPSRPKKSKVLVSAPSAGLVHTYGYSGHTFQRIQFPLHIKPAETSKLPVTTTSPILRFAAGEVSFGDCFENFSDPMLPEQDEKPESITGGIKAQAKNERNLNSVRRLLSQQEFAPTTEYLLGRSYTSMEGEIPGFLCGHGHFPARTRAVLGRQLLHRLPEDRHRRISLPRLLWVRCSMQNVYHQKAPAITSPYTRGAISM
jgi:hypothetical protein